MNDTPHAPGPQPGPERDDLGLTPDQWMDLAYAYNFGLIEPEPGTVEDKAFDRMDAHARSDWARQQQAEREAEAGS